MADSMSRPPARWSARTYGLGPSQVARLARSRPEVNPVHHLRLCNLNTGSAARPGMNGEAARTLLSFERRLSRDVEFAVLSAD